MTTPAVRAAALEPSPLPSGISLSISSAMGGKNIADIGGHGQCGAPDQIVFAGRNLRGIAAAHANRQARGALKPARQIDSERQTEAIESGTEIGAGSWNADLHSGVLREARRYSLTTDPFRQDS